MFIITFFIFLGTVNSLKLLEKNDSDYLLPDNVVIPLNYQIEIDVSNSFNEIPPKNFIGEVSISAFSKKPINNITIHALSMTFLSVNIFTSTNPVKNLFNSVIVNQEKQFYYLGLNESIKEYTKFQINIKYNGTLQTDMYGFYVSSYEDNNKTEYLLSTQFQPTHARKAFPCFDEPKYKATFNLTIKKPEQYGALSNMNTKSTIGETQVVFHESNKMSTYLVAFVISKFEFNSKESQFKVWARSNAIDQTQIAVNFMYPVVKGLSDFTSINYTDYVPKMDLVAIPDFAAGAMENWGLLTYRERLLLAVNNITTTQNEQQILTVIAHEVAHQWFGDLVTLNWWDNTWLNEGFATYFMYHKAENDSNIWELKEQFVIDQLQTVLESDASNKTTPLTLDVFTPEQITGHFGSISYNKGGSVIRMMEHFLGYETFQKGLQNYLHKRALNNSVPKDLWTSLQELSNNNNLNYTIEEIMTTWISQPGYPLVTITVNQTNVTFEQKRFLMNPEDDKKDSNNFWYIPISYTTSDEQDFNSTKPKLWLTPEQPKKTLKIDVKNWFIANIKQTGYFRVNYNTEYWKILSNTLKTVNKTDINRINRAQIIDDIMNLARSGIVDYTITFELLDYLETETDYYPWFSSFRGFTYLLQKYSTTDKTGILLRKYILKLMSSLLWNKSLNFSTNYLKPTTIYNTVNALQWACNLGNITCIEDSKRLYQHSFIDIDKNLRNIVYCTAIRHGNKQDWDKLWDTYVKSNLAFEKVNIINALGCSNDTEVLENYLIKSIENKEIRNQDAAAVFVAVYEGGFNGVESALNFLKTYPEEISKNYGGMNALNNAVIGLANYLNNETQIKKFQEILNDNIFENVRDDAMKIIRQNQIWAEIYGNYIEEILNQKNIMDINIII